MHANRFYGSLVAVASLGLVIGATAPAHADQTSDGSGGVLSGNQVSVPVSVEVCGNSVAVAGVSQAECEAVLEQAAQQGSAEQSDDGAQQSSDGSGGVASGNQVEAPIDARVCGNAVAVFGVATAECRDGEESEEPEETATPPEEPEETATPPQDEGSEPAPSTDGPPAQADDGTAPQRLPLTGPALAALVGASGALVAGGLALRRLARRGRSAR